MRDGDGNEDEEEIGVVERTTTKRKGKRGRMGQEDSNGYNNSKKRNKNMSGTDKTKKKKKKKKKRKSFSVLYVALLVLLVALGIRLFERATTRTVSTDNVDENGSHGRKRPSEKGNTFHDELFASSTTTDKMKEDNDKARVKMLKARDGGGDDEEAFPPRPQLKPRYPIVNELIAVNVANGDGGSGVAHMNVTYMKDIVTNRTFFMLFHGLFNQEEVDYYNRHAEHYAPDHSVRHKNKWRKELFLETRDQVKRLDRKVFAPNILDLCKMHFGISLAYREMYVFFFFIFVMHKVFFSSFSPFSPLVARRFLSSFF